MFIDLMNSIISLHQQQEKFNDVLKEIDSEFGGCYINNKSIDKLYNLLKDLTNDSSDIIGYWLWELEFGERYEEGCVTEEDGTPIPLKTLDDVWNYLVDENK